MSDAPRRPKARQRAAQARASALDVEALAIATLRQVASSRKVPGAARAQAARALLEMAGKLGRNAMPAPAKDAPPDAITLAALDARIAALEKAR